jgi:hypothetical protein
MVAKLVRVLAASHLPAKQVLTALDDVGKFKDQGTPGLK